MCLWSGATCWRGTRAHQFELLAGALEAALRSSSVAEIFELKRRYLGASVADGRGGEHTTGVRGWMLYCVWGLGVSPLPDEQRMRVDFAYAALIEDRIEDFAIWYVTFKPYGRDVSHQSMGKYVSQVRAWYHRTTRGVLGLGAEGSRVADVLKGYARLVDQPPPLEREGCMPDDLRAGIDAVYPRGASAASAAMRAALTYGFASFSRGCEFALDDGRREAFDSTQHVTPGDVTPVHDAGTLHLRVRMRKRKDLRVLRGKHSEVLLAGGGAVLDPVSDMVEWLHERRALGLPEDGPLFCWPDGRSFTVRDIRGAVRAAMQAAGRDPALYGAHSLRIGAATAALASGVPPQLIRLMGRWSSDVYELYCRMSLQSALRVGVTITSAAGVRPVTRFEEEQLELLPQEVAAIGRDVVR
jgi:hypothetical protein